MSEYQTGRARTSETQIKEIEKQVSGALTEMFRRAVNDGVVQDKKDEKSDLPKEGVVQDCEFGMILLLGRDWLRTRNAVPPELADGPVREMVIKLVSNSLETLLNRKRFDIGGEFGDKVFFSGAPYTRGARGSSANLDSAMLVLGFLAPALKEYHEALSNAPGPANKPAPWVNNLRDVALFVCMEGVRYAANCQVHQPGFAGFTCDPRSIWNEQDKTKPYLDEYDRLFFTWTASETIRDLLEWEKGLNEIADGVPTEELAALRRGIQELGGAIQDAALWCKSVFLDRLRNLQEMNVDEVVAVIEPFKDQFLPPAESEMVENVAKYVQHVYHMSQYAAIRSLSPAEVTIGEVNDILDRINVLVSDDIIGSRLDASEQATLFTTLTRQYSLGVGVSIKYEDDAYYPLVVRSMAALLTRTMDRIVANASSKQITDVVLGFRRVLEGHHKNLIKRRPADPADKDLWSFADRQPYILYATQRTIFALLTYADFLKKMDEFEKGTDPDEELEADIRRLLTRELLDKIFGNAVKEIVAMAATRASARRGQAEVVPEWAAQVVRQWLEELASDFEKEKFEDYLLSRAQNLVILKRWATGVAEPTDKRLLAKLNEVNADFARLMARYGLNDGAAPQEFVPHLFRDLFNGDGKTVAQWKKEQPEWAVVIKNAEGLRSRLNM